MTFREGNPQDVSHDTAQQVGAETQEADALLQTLRLNAIGVIESHGQSHRSLLRGVESVLGLNPVLNPGTIDLSRALAKEGIGRAEIGAYRSARSKVTTSDYGVIVTSLGDVPPSESKAIIVRQSRPFTAANLDFLILYGGHGEIWKTVAYPTFNSDHPVRRVDDVATVQRFARLVDRVKTDPILPRARTVFQTVKGMIGAHLR